MSHQIVHILIADSVDSDIVVALYRNGELCRIVSSIYRSNLCRLDELHRQTACFSFSAQYHLEALGLFLIKGIEVGSYHIVLASLQVDRLRNQIVVTGKVVVVLVVSIVSSVFPLPCVVIAVGINHLAALESIASREVNDIRNLCNVREISHDSIARHTLTLVVVSNHLIRIVADGQRLVLVNIAELAARSYILKGLDDVAITQNLNLCQVARQVLSLHILGRSLEADGGSQLTR